ncbi:MAG: hypothetical protein ACI30N_05880 [Muribaculaceae bacterium]
MKTVHLLITMAVAATLFSCSGKEEEKNRQNLADISKQELATALSERDQLLSLVKEVSTGMNEIKQLEGIMTVAENQPADSPAQKAQILADISNIKAKIEERKARLNELESKLSKSTINNKELKETIEALRTQIDTQMEEIESLRQQLTAANEHIGVLNSTVDSLNTTVTTVTGERDAAQEKSVRLTDELNTCYYVVTTKSELKKHKIIESGFLRKTKLMKGDFDRGLFTVADKRTLTELPLNAKKAKVLTNHPASSYRIVDRDGKKVLHITSPADFWSLTNYLVIQQD